MAPMLELHAYADGGSRGNPGPAAYGWCLVTPDGDLRQEGWGVLPGGIGTNNEAEYAAACEVAEAARRLRVTDLVLHMDSKLVIEQLTKVLGLGRGWDTSAEHLVPYQERFADAVAGLLAGPRRAAPRLALVWIPRADNRYADALVNKALDERYGPATRAVRPVDPSGAGRYP